MSDQSPMPNLRKHAEWMVQSGQFRGTVEQYLGYLRPRYTEQQWHDLTEQGDSSDIAIDHDPSPGIPDVHPPTITISRDCAGYAWLSLMKVGDDLLPPDERTKAKQELYAALWPDVSACSEAKQP